MDVNFLKKMMSPVSVGVLMIVGAISFIYLYRGVVETTLGDEDSYVVYAIFDNVSGLVNSSRVQIAGIDVGYIDNIELVGSKARVTIRVKRKIQLLKNATISIFSTF